MAGYRDPLEAARLRIESLEANLAERDAALAAREAELRELVAELARRGPPGPGPRAAWAATVVAGLVGASSLLVAAHAQQQRRAADAGVERARGEARRHERWSAEPSPLAHVAPLAPTAAPEFEPPPFAAAVPLPLPLEAAAPFDRAAAGRALNEAAERARRACRRAGASTLPTAVRVTFRPDGKVWAAAIDSPLGGTAAGGCVLAAFNRAAVPPFAGGPVVVNKSFAWHPAPGVLERPARRGP